VNRVSQRKNWHVHDIWTINSSHYTYCILISYSQGGFWESNKTLEAVNTVPSRPQKITRLHAILHGVLLKSVRNNFLYWLIVLNCDSHPWWSSGLSCLPLDPRFIGSNLARDDGFLRAIKNLQHDSSCLWWYLPEFWWINHEWLEIKVSLSFTDLIFSEIHGPSWMAYSSVSQTPLPIKTFTGQKTFIAGSWITVKKIQVFFCLLFYII
jgi:hypothetical protein